MPTTPDERRRLLLDEYFTLWDQREDLRRRRLSAPSDNVLEAAADAVLRRMQQLADEYRALLDRYSLSRCPFCAAATVLSFDPEGIDGLYWNYDAPIRPVDPRPCPHFLVMAGAMKLVEPVRSVPMLAVPGPEAPWVVPRLLESHNVRAVLSEVPVGAHTGFATVYYSDGTSPGSLVNAWGTSQYERIDPAGRRQWDESTPTPRDEDYDLPRWVASGRLQWIAPRDRQLQLRSDLQGFAYSNLQGRRGFVKVQDGLTWVYGWELDRP